MAPKMGLWPYVILRCLSGIVCCIVMMLAWFPATLKDPSICHRCGNESTAVAEMTVRVFAFLDTAPMPFLNVTDKELNRFWNLPPMTVISPTMRSIGMCRMAVERNNRAHPDICNRVVVVWMIAACAVATLDYLYVIYSGFKVELWIKWWHDPSTMPTHIAVFQLVRAAMWYSIMLMAFFEERDQSIDLSFTIAGEIFPAAYYTKMPTTWLAVFFLCFVNLGIVVIEMWCLAGCSNSKSKKNRS